MTPRPNILGYTVLAAFGLGLVYIALSDESESGAGNVVPMPRGKLWTWEPPPNPSTWPTPVPKSLMFGENLFAPGDVQNQFFAMATSGNSPTYMGSGNETQARAALDAYMTRRKQLVTDLHTGWQANRRSLPADANPMRIDKYTTQLFWMPGWVGSSSPNENPSDAATRVTLYKLQTTQYRNFDEYGRTVKSEDGSGGGILQMFSAMLQNPLFQAIVVTAIAVYTGPAGVAAYGAFNAYVVRGQEFSVENVALSTARTYVVSQCGPACGAAFDIGVGVASGESVDEAAETALLNQMSPDERVAYEQGKELYRGVA